MRNTQLVEEAKYILKKINQSPKKSLGQNFLVDSDLLKEIARLGEIHKNENIIEIGPGLGWLTNELIKYFPNLTLVEKDDQLVQFLKEKFGNTVNLIHGDILDDKIWKKFPSKSKIIANIPYNLTTPLIQKIITNIGKFDLAVLLVQLEVAQRLAANAGQSNRGALSVALQTVCDTELGPIVAPNSFWPAPNVESQILILKPNSKTIDPEFINFLYKGFMQKRKKISNSITAGLAIKKEIAIELLTYSKIDANLRPEDLNLAQWLKLWSQYKSII